MEPLAGIEPNYENKPELKPDEVLYFSWFIVTLTVIYYSWIYVKSKIGNRVRPSAQGEREKVD
jgi:hypothetical protein